MSSSPAYLKIVVVQCFWLDEFHFSGALFWQPESCRYASTPNICGSLRAPQFSFNQLAIYSQVSLSITLAPSGQFFMQAQHLMHFSTFVVTLPLIDMAAVGQTLTHVPQTVHTSPAVTGEISSGRAPSALYG